MYRKDTVTVRDDLYEACKGGDSEKVANLLRHNSIPTLVKHGWRKRTSLHVACEAGHLECVRHLHEMYGKIFQVVDADQCTPLHVACMHGNVHIVEYILTNTFVDCDFVNLYGETPLHFASAYGNHDCVQALALKGEADLNKANHTGLTALHLACKNGYSNIVEFLLSFPNCDPHKKTKKHGNCAIHVASRGGHLDCIRCLVDLANIDLNVKNFRGRTSLDFACKSGHAETVAYLLKLKCNPTLKCPNLKETPLHIASFYGHTECLRMVYETGLLDVNSLNVHKQTALHLACLNGRLDATIFLLGAPNCNPNLKDIDGNTALHLTISNNHHADMYTDCFKALLSNKKINVDAKNNLLRTPLHLICINGLETFVAILLAKAIVLLSLQDSFGNTPLHYAALHGHLRCIELINCESCLTIRNNENYTMLDLACLKGHTRVVEYLLKHYPFHKSLANRSKSSAFLCGKLGNLECLKLHITNKYVEDVNETDVHGRTILHYSCQNGRVSLVQYLLFELKCNPNIEDKDGFTPLHLASINGHVQCLQLLLDINLCLVSCEDKKLDKKYCSDLLCSKFLLEEEKNNPLAATCANGHFECVVLILKPLSFYT